MISQLTSRSIRAITISALASVVALLIGCEKQKAPSEAEAKLLNPPSEAEAKLFNQQILIQMKRILSDSEQSISAILTGQVDNIRENRSKVEAFSDQYEIQLLTKSNEGYLNAKEAATIIKSFSEKILSSYDDLQLLKIVKPNTRNPMERAVILLESPHAKNWTKKKEKATELLSRIEAIKYNKQ